MAPYGRCGVAGLKRGPPWVDTPSMRRLFALAGGQARPQQARELARHAVSRVECQLGRVVDLSSAGMRVVSRGPAPLTLGQSVLLHLEFRQGVIDVQAIVRWSRRSGWRDREIGLQFSFPRDDDERAYKLEQLARFGFVLKRKPDDAPVPPPAMSIRADLPDYYAVLGVQPGADIATIRRAFHERAKASHPDVGGGHEEFMRAHRAWEVLQHPARRRAYDRSRRLSA